MGVVFLLVLQEQLHNLWGQVVGCVCEQGGNRKQHLEHISQTDAAKQSAELEDVVNFTSFFQLNIVSATTSDMI